MSLLLGALVGSAALAVTTSAQAAPAPRCEPVGLYRITGYARSEYGPHARTYDGTSVWTGEKLVAASWNIPLDTLLRVEGLDHLYRVADRGMLGSEGWIDVLVDDVPTAYKLEEWVGGKYGRVCVERWGR